MSFEPERQLAKVDSERIHVHAIEAVNGHEPSANPFGSGTGIGGDDGLLGTW